MTHRPKLIIVAGLPGAGKTTYLKLLKGRPELSWYYDDFQDHSRNKSSDPRHSRYYGSLIKHLRNNATVAIADIRYVIPREIRNLLQIIEQALPSASLLVEVHYFENNPQQCLDNSKMRAARIKSRDFAHERSLILHYSPLYAKLADRSIKEVVVSIV